MTPGRAFRTLGVIVLFLVAALWIALVFVFPKSKPPKESNLIENFYAHRAAYERLRDMLLADDQLLRVAGWGVETTKPVGIYKPPEGGFPVNRYNEYLALLRETAGKVAFRERGEHPGVVGVDVWVSGWAGDTRHVSICWVDHEPTNQVASLNDFYKTPKPRRPVFKRIDGNWYLWADW
jgi:hypothetical protein